MGQFMQTWMPSCIFYFLNRGHLCILAIRISNDIYMQFIHKRFTFNVIYFVLSVKINCIFMIFVYSLEN